MLPISAKITDAMEAALAQVSQVEVHRITHRGQSPSHRTVFVVPGEARRVNDSPPVDVHDEQPIQWVRPYRCECYVRLPEDDPADGPIDQQLDVIAADLQKKLKEDPFWGGLADRTELVDPELYLDANPPACVVQADVYFTVNPKNPYESN